MVCETRRICSLKMSLLVVGSMPAACILLYSRYCMLYNVLPPCGRVDAGIVHFVVLYVLYVVQCTPTWWAGRYAGSVHLVVLYVLYVVQCTPTWLSGRCRQSTFCCTVCCTIYSNLVVGLMQTAYILLYSMYCMLYNVLPPGGRVDAGSVHLVVLHLLGREHGLVVHDASKQKT
jgi:hypothetical protein